MKKNIFRLFLLGVGLSFLAFSCSSSSDNESSSSTSTSEAPISNLVSASAVGCPEQLIVQTDWFPEPEHAYLYQLIGINGDIDSTNGTYSGLIPDTDITLEVRAGGPYVDFASPSEQFYSDTDIYMGYVDTSTAIEGYATTPAVAVFTSFDVGPQILMWDPEVYDFETFEDIGDSGATVLHFGGANYIKYLVANGTIDESNTDGSYDGGPARFIAEGNIVQQGFATAEPFKYLNEHEGWLKPVDFLLIHDSGHEIYQSALSVRPETIQNDEECLAFIVPLMQQALVDYMNDPEPINIRLDEIVKALNSFWTSSIEGHNWTSQQMRDLGLITDGSNGYLGDMDGARIQRLIDELAPIYGADGTDGFGSGDARLEAEQIFTNRFLDESISLGY